MKVVAYLHDFPPGRLLGGEIMTSLLLEALVKAGHEVDAIVHEASETRIRNGVRVLPRRKAMLSNDLAGYDLFISHPEIASFARNRVGSAPFVAIVHNLNPTTVDALKITKTNLIVANAEDTARRVRNYCREVMVLHPPTPVGRHPQTGHLPRTFVTLVNLSQDKGAKVFYALAEARPDLCFLGVVGGHGEQIRPGTMPDNVWLLGQSESMGLIYEMTNVLLLPSATETYGMVGAEAMLAGIPVIAHPLPGIKEALGNAAIYVDRDDLAGWERELVQLQSQGYYDRWQGLAGARGDFLAHRSAEDLQRFVTRCEELALVSAHQR